MKSLLYLGILNFVKFTNFVMRLYPAWMLFEKSEQKVKEKGCIELEKQWKNKEKVLLWKVSVSKLRETYDKFTELLWVLASIICA